MTRSMWPRSSSLEVGVYGLTTNDPLILKGKIDCPTLWPEWNFWQPLCAVAVPSWEVDVLSNGKTKAVGRRRKLKSENFHLISQFPIDSLGSFMADQMHAWKVWCRGTGWSSPPVWEDISRWDSPGSPSSPAGISLLVFVSTRSMTEAPFSSGQGLFWQ